MKLNKSVFIICLILSAGWTVLLTSNWVYQYSKIPPFETIVKEAGNNDSSGMDLTAFPPRIDFFLYYYVLDAYCPVFYWADFSTKKSMAFNSYCRPVSGNQFSRERFHANLMLVKDKYARGEISKPVVGINYYLMGGIILIPILFLWILVFAATKVMCCLKNRKK